MSLEPQDAYTVLRRPVMPPKGPDTYREKLIARFGRVPSMAELAKSENAAGRHAFNRPAPVKQPPALPPAPKPAREPEIKRTRAEALRDRAERMNAAAQKRILGILTHPMTLSNLTSKANMCRSGVDRQLKALMADGLVKRGFTDGAYVWWTVADVARKQEQGAA